MTVTFPHMGTLHIALRALLAAAGVKALAPPPPSKRTLELGTKYSPETACLPFKMNIGNYIEALEAGADTILTCGGAGPCRLGYYAEIQRAILADLGYDFRFIVVEPKIGSVWQAAKVLAAAAGWRRTYDAVRLAGAKLTALAAIERAACFARPRAAAPGSVDAIRRGALAAVDAAASPPAVRAAADTARARLAGLPAADPPPAPLRVGLAGEIFVMLDDWVNQDIVRRLGAMGVEVHPTMLLDDYVRTHVLRTRPAMRALAAVTAQAGPYLGHYVGGHGVKSVGHTAALGRAGFDGMVHLFPFTCMPEIVARSILPAVSRDTGIPVLSLACDEQTGEAGMATRLEAFVDLLEYRRRRKEIAGTAQKEFGAG